MFKRYLVSLVVVFGLAAVFVSSAVADAPAPGWEVFGYFSPTNLSPGGNGVLQLHVYNTGASAIEEEGPTLVDELPEGLEAEPGGKCSGTKVVTCTMREIPPGPNPRSISINVHVAADASDVGNPVDHVSVSGAGALGPAAATIPVVYSSEPAGLGFVNVDGWITNADGTVDTQAGSHPYELTMAFAPNADDIEDFELPAGGEAQALDVNLPPGLVGEPSAVPECTRQQFDSVGSGEGCPGDSQIGEDIAVVAGGGGSFAVYNLVPPPGVAAQFGFDFNGTHTFLDARVRSGGDYGITEHVNVPQLKILFNTITIWGFPGKHSAEEKGETRSESELAEEGQRPLLTLPTSCGEPPEFTQEMLGTWQHPDATAPVASFKWHNSEGTPVSITGCEKLVHFTPTLEISPETSFSDTPTGLKATVRVPQGLNPEGLATSGLKETTVTLPEGLVVNPGQATGLQACQPAQENVGGPEAELESKDGPPECPAASKIGTDEIATPLLPHRLKGNVYILQNNPPDLKLLVAAEGEGVFLKLIGNVHLDERTGRLTTTFKGVELPNGQFSGTPDAPLNEFVLSFSGGAQAALVTPSTCGQYPYGADFRPWSYEFVEDSFASGNFSITAGPGGGGSCTNPLPFSPSLTAGSTTDQAGGFTDFSMLLQRPDGQQRIQKLQFKTPEGLLGMISKVPLCKEPLAASGECSESSQIGHTVVGAGPGPYPLFIPQAGAPPAPIFLTEGYEGAPYGLSIKVPIVAGPFTLETKIVRARIEVDPHTAQLTVTTDPLPTIVSGIPADLRSIDAVIDRPGFMFNPTHCAPLAFTGTATSTEGANAPLSYRFQVGSCQALQFKPDFKVSTAGKTSKKDGASLEAKIVYPTTPLGANQASSQSNIASVKVDLPKQLPSRLTTLQKACTAAQFESNPAGCPKESLVGHATAVTPVLPVPLNGPAYFVSHGGEAFPSLIVVLQGYGVTVDLVGTTFISKAGITSSTFKQVPDVPIYSFDLTLGEGPFSALTANLPVKDHYSLCGQKLTMPTAFTAQNGAVIHQSTPIGVTGCAKAKTLTRAQKLAKALKACHKQAKGKRAGCERAARKRYGPAKRRKK